jgi:hypothetical protein
MTKAFLIGAAAAALLAVPAAAQRDGPAPAFDRAQIEGRIAERFQRVDADRDGFVTREEAEGARAGVRAQRQERRSERRAALFARLDSDRNGVISREEFERPQARANGERHAERGERRAERGERRGQRFAHRRGGRMGGGFGGEAFARLDSNRDGRVSLAEATAARLQRFDRVDSNRDGRIDREEIQAARAERGERARQAR